MENRFFIKFLTRNRPLRGFATLGEANTPSGASAERRKVAECAEGVGVQSWSQGKERSL